MLWIDSEPNRLLFQGVQRYTAPTGTGRGAMSGRTVPWCLLGYSFPEDEIRTAFASLRK